MKFVVGCMYNLLCSSFSFYFFCIDETKNMLHLVGKLERLDAPRVCG